MLRRSTSHQQGKKPSLAAIFSKSFMAKSLLRKVSKAVFRAPHEVDDVRFLLSAEPLQGSRVSRRSVGEDGREAPLSTLMPRLNFNLPDAHEREPLDVIAVDHAVRRDLRVALRDSSTGSPPRDHMDHVSRKGLQMISNRTAMMSNHIRVHSQLTRVGSGNIFDTVLPSGKCSGDAKHPSSSQQQRETTESELRAINMAKLAAILEAHGPAQPALIPKANEIDLAVSEKGKSNESEDHEFKKLVSKYMWINGRLGGSSFDGTSVGAVSPGRKGVHLSPISERVEGPFPFAEEFLSSSPFAYDFEGGDSDTPYSLLSDPQHSGHRLLHTPTFVIEEKLPDCVVSENDDVILVLVATKLEDAQEPVPNARQLDGVTRCRPQTPRYLIEMRLVPQVHHTQASVIPVVVNSFMCALDCGRRLLRRANQADDEGHNEKPAYETERSASGEDESGGGANPKANSEAQGESPYHVVSTPTLVEYIGLMGASDTITISQLLAAKSPLAPREKVRRAEDGEHDMGDDRTIFTPFNRSFSLSLATMDGPAALKGRIYYKMVPTSQQAAESPSSLKSGVVQTISRAQAAESPIRSIEFCPIALR